MKSVAFTGIAAGVLALVACSAAGNKQAAPTSAPAPSPVVYDCAGNPHTKPASYTLACADAGIALSKVTWSSWSASGAKGTGQLGVNNCQPDCASGTFGYTPATITLSSPHGGAGSSYFTLTWRSPARPCRRTCTVGHSAPGGQDHDRHVRASGPRPVAVPGRRGAWIASRACPARGSGTGAAWRSGRVSARR